MDKEELRIKCKKIRQTLDIKETSEKIVSNLRKTEFYKNSKNIMIFYPLEYEINLLDLLNDTDKNFYLPKVKEKDLLVCPYKKNNKLETGKYNIQEPITQPINPERLDLIIFPALAIDKNKNRLGYGGGYYDRFSSKIKKAKFVAVIPKELVFDIIPTEEFDKKMDYVIMD